MANFGQTPDALAGALERLADSWREAWQATLQHAQAAPSAQTSSDRPEDVQSEGAADPAGALHAVAGLWLEKLQALAGTMADVCSQAPEEIVQAWRSALGDDPFGTLFSGLPGGSGSAEFLSWMQPWLEMLVNAAPILGLPQGQRLRWQRLAEALAACREGQKACRELLRQASETAYARFGERLGRAGTDSAPATLRQLLDLWVDVAEEVYAEVAMSSAFQSAYAGMVNGQMRLRQVLQQEAGLLCDALDLPTRAELDSAHRRAMAQEREIRQLRDRLDALEARSTAPAKRAVRKAPRKAAPKQAASARQTKPTGTRV